MVIVVLALGLAVGIQAFVVKPYQIPSESMVPTLGVGQRVLVNRFIYEFTDPKINDVIVFHPPVGAERGVQCGVVRKLGQPCPKATPREAEVNFIKRIVAGPGDTIKIDGGVPVVNGVRAREDFITPCQPGGECNLPRAITIPAGHYFMMGDNRGASDDSRFWGPIPKRWIIGQAFATYWPPDRIGFF